MRKLTAEEVEFTIGIEPENIPIEGNASAWGDGTDEVYWAAWCIVVVKAKWKRWTGGDSLGWCSFAASYGPALEKEIEECVEMHAMREAALDDLNAQIAATAAELRELQ